MSDAVSVSRPSIERCSWCKEPFIEGQLAVVVRGFSRTGESSWYYETCGETCGEIVETLMRIGGRPREEG